MHVSVGTLKEPKQKRLKLLAYATFVTIEGKEERMDIKKVIAHSRATSKSVSHLTIRISLNSSN